MDESWVNSANIMFLEIALIILGQSMLSILSMFFISGHFKTNTTFKGYTVQIEIFRSKMETLICKNKLLRAEIMKCTDARGEREHPSGTLYCNLASRTLLHQHALILDDHIEHKISNPFHEIIQNDRPSRPDGTRSLSLPSSS